MKPSKLLVKILDVFPPKVPVKILGTKISELRARALVKKLTPKGTKLKFEIGSWGDVKVATLGTKPTHHTEGIILVDRGALYEEVILHELGHFVYIQNESSQNHKGWLNWKNHERLISDRQEYRSELEAWQFVRDFYGDQFGSKREYLQAFAIKGYEKAAELKSIF